MRTALILGHPGHELRVFRFLEIHQPIVYVLTDGSGNNGGASRISSTKKVLETTGASPGKVFGRFTDKQIYDHILSQNIDAFSELIGELEEDLRKQGIERIAGDACEGYNPTHDLCRYMINAIAEKNGFENYDYLLDGPPHACPEELKKAAIWMHLNEEEFARKLAAVDNYPELLEDVRMTLEKHGKAPFMIECLRPVKGIQKLNPWSTPLPHYETYAKSKIEQGKYDQIISFEKHLLPLAERLRDYAHSNY